MRMIVLFLALFLSLDSHSLITRTHFSLNLVAGCTIYSFYGETLKRFPGAFCIFKNNGDFVSMSPTHIKYYKKNLEVAWSIQNPYFHHQINESNDDRELLTMGSIEKEIDGKLYRDDVLLVINSEDGKILKSIDGEEILKQMNSKPLGFVSSFPQMNFKTNLENSHFNSFYQIPKLQEGTKGPSWLKEGNYIANSTGLGVFVFDKNLKKVLHYLSFPNAFLNNVHDVQITKRGTLIGFVNAVLTKDGSRFSNVTEIDLNSNKIIGDIRSNPENFFYSEYCGGVQDLGNNDEVLFSHNYAGVFLYSKKMKKIVYSNYNVFKQGSKLVLHQQVKAYDLNKFLSIHAKSSF